MARRSFLSLVRALAGDRGSTESTQPQKDEQAGQAQADPEPLPAPETGRDEDSADHYYQLGLKHADGQGGDLAEALRCLLLAAERGHAEAQHSVAEMYDTGRGVAPDEAEAIRWYLRAAEHGHSRAQHSLGVAYALGESVPQDVVAAYVWLTLATTGASPEDRTDFALDRDGLRLDLTEGQVADAERRVREWTPTSDSTGAIQE